MPFPIHNLLEIPKQCIEKHKMFVLFSIDSDIFWTWTTYKANMRIIKKKIEQKHLCSTENIISSLWGESKVVYDWKLLRILVHICTSVQFTNMWFVCLQNVVIVVETCYLLWIMCPMFFWSFNVFLWKSWHYNYDSVISNKNILQSKE